MPVRAAGEPPFNIVRCAYVTLGVTDLARSRDFYVDALGLTETEATGEAVYLRGLEERSHHSIVLVQRASPEAHALGFKVASEGDLDALEAFFAARGLPASWTERHAQGRTLAVRDPFGVPLEFYARMDGAERLLQRYGLYRGAQIMRLDHLNLFAAELQQTHEFYAELGFRTTEYTETEGPDPRLWAVWMHRKGNVHDVALTNGRGPRLHHVGVWTASVMSILHACDVLATTGHVDKLERGPGRHGISNAFFLYLRDPDGHRVELFASDYLTVDPDLEPLRWTLDDPQRQTLWGHAAPASWFEEGTPFAGTAVREPALRARPVVAR
ncbi:3,4-dihydroxyphenylacetate 2,3-dioxygenase [Truepera radiovictrix]|uniref:3,4-dihydroxyphenylacetate 2,3-dioxygenase n=1 Tax=Truepera radiovictrix (strain DSM 17093 / CIP 108686 / LMG 22925 / RQ-24) TaxID=649638 RepID=D7CQL9_TRURR|nr:3,4-dihydroxyphenylacetate 2,3-dioxygenase [Truepera radiovictrix]ADI15003.1 3,4-dihydroxyphenylacetate 2,3-dioxygenase [Truepera radiovictrix DSM 17093]WMT56444.1 3,4-dihydroxyphenylacetate 2,3-dioxygenase [Truepera radiovictrix]